MEPEIRADLPASSPIVAYGATRQPGGKKFLAILAGTFVLVLIGIALWMTLAWQVSLPKDIVLLAAVHGGSTLPDGLPVVWQNAVRVKHPVILGLAKTETGVVPFSIGLTTDGAGGETHVDVWPFVISSDTQLQTNEKRPVRDLMSLATQLGKHEAFVELDTLALLGNAERISGAFDDGVWHTNASLASNNATLLPGDVAINLAALPDAWPSVRDALANAVPTLALDERPQSISWSMASSTPIIRANFDGPLATSTELAFMTAAGIYDINQVALPDGSVEEELLPPTRTLAAASSLTFPSTTGTTALSMTGSEVMLGDASSSAPTPCGSPISVFMLDQTALEPILRTWNLQLPVAGISVSSDNGKMDVELCKE